MEKNGIVWYHMVWYHNGTIWYHTVFHFFNFSIFPLFNFPLFPFFQNFQFFHFCNFPCFPFFQLFNFLCFSSFQLFPTIFYVLYLKLFVEVCLHGTSRLTTRAIPQNRHRHIRCQPGPEGKAILDSTALS